MSDEIKALTGGGASGGIADISVSYVRGGSEGQIFADSLHGRFYELAKRGRVFIACTAVGGLALPIYSATAQLFMIWNPANSGVNLELICAKFGRVSTVGSDGHLTWGYKANMGSALGTPCSAFTAGTPVNTMLGGQADSTTNFAPATATVTAPSYLRPVGITQTEAADTQIYAPYMLLEDFNVDPLIIAPGAAIFACQNIAASTVYSVSVTYARVPA